MHKCKSRDTNATADELCLDWTLEMAQYANIFSISLCKKKVKNISNLILNTLLITKTQPHSIRMHIYIYKHMNIVLKNEDYFLALVLIG